MNGYNPRTETIAEQIERLESTPNDELRELVEQWRNEADQLRDDAPHDMAVENVQASVREEKADELEALIEE